MRTWKKRGKTAKAVNVKGKQRKILAVEERSIRGKVGECFFLWDKGAGNMICFRLSDLLILCTNFGATCSVGGSLAL